MHDTSKTYQDLIKENALLRQQIDELQASGPSRRQTDAVLRESEARLKEAQRIVKIGNWELDLLTNKLICSDEIFRIFEIEKEGFGASYDAFLEVIYPEDRDAVNAAYVQSLEHHRPYEITHRLRMQDGRIKYVHERCESYYNPEGKPVRSIGTVQDITERKRAEEKLQLIQKAVEDSSDAIGLADAQGNHFYQNKAFTRLLGYTVDELKVKGVAQAVYADQEVARDVFETIMKGGSWSGEVEDIAKDGRRLTVMLRADAIKDETGKVIGLLAINTDITEQKRAEESLSKSERKFSSTFHFNPNAMAISEIVTSKFIDVNEAFTSQTGYSREEIIGKSAEDLQMWVNPDDRKQIINALKEKGEIKGTEVLMRFKNNNIRNVLFSARFVEIEQDNYLLTFALDITNRKQAEENIRVSEEKFSMAFHNSPTMMTITTLRDQRFVDVNGSFLRLHGYDRDEIVGHALHELDLVVDRSLLESIPREARDSGMIKDREIQFRNKAGGTFWGLLSSAPITIAGEPCLLGQIIDITDRKRAEEALRQSEELFRGIFNSTFQLAGVLAPDGVVIKANQTFLDFVGLSMSDVVNRPIWDARWFSEDEIRVRKIKEAVKMAACGDFVRYEVDWQGAGATAMNIDFSLKPVYGVSGEVAMLIAEGRDITDIKRAEMERTNLQEQLFQSQKLEAVGVLAGGVAHDFNNILGAIIGYAEITMDKMATEDPLRKNLGKILDAAQRSSNITRQLLAFARKQVIAPVSLDLNESVEATLKMIRRLIGENIELTWSPATSPCKVMMDPSQLDQILLNLCVNARDAIGGIGKLTIETEVVLFDRTYCLSHAEIIPGSYVQLSVSDNGCGMDEETQKHIFEPFFTTKGLGQGTGMGLATVYGIVKQNEGFVHVYSEVGKGTTFKIYIPLHTVKTPDVKKAIGQDLPRGRGETILIVEDDPMILEISTTMLKNLGYSVLSASTPGESIRMAQDAESEIHLLITDVVMPEMNGRDLAQQLVAIQPTIKRLFMSGYTADVIAHQGGLDEGAPFISKPFLLKDLATKIREILDE